MVSVQNFKDALVIGGTEGYGKAISNFLMHNEINTSVASKDSIHKDSYNNFIKCDITSENELNKLSKQIEQRHKALDLLVITAATPQSGYRQLLDINQYKFLKDMLEVNFFGQLRSILKLKPMLDKKIEALVLGCTHYNFLQDVLTKILPNHIEIWDARDAIANRTAYILDDYKMRSTNQSQGNTRILTNSNTTAIQNFVGDTMKIEILLNI